jgi:DNA polymerase III subunit epsilon
VIDFETTGASANTCAITEVGAAKYHAGECIGTLQTLVNPGCEIPPEIVYLTGITQTMVGPAPRIEAVLPSLLEFIGDAIIVGHNVRFDLGFLNAALSAHSYPKLSNRSVDTVSLARRLVRQEVANCKLGTLSQHFGFDNQPTHRALDDVRATADLLHLLLERAAGFGVLGLDDLSELPAINRHPQAPKLALTNDLPRCPGVYLFRDRSGAVIYVGKATNLRARVRSYFSSDDRRKIGPMLEILDRIDHIPCALTIEAEVLEVRFIQRYLPRFNREAKFHTKYAYLRITGDGKTAKIVTTKDAGGIKGATYLGPFSSVSAARISAVALREAASMHNGPWRETLKEHPETLLRCLHEKMRSHAGDERFEEAAAIRDRAGTLARAIDRQQRISYVRAAGSCVVEVGDATLRIEHGRLRFTEAAQTSSPEPDLRSNPLSAVAPLNLVDELTRVVRFLERDRKHTLRSSEFELYLPPPTFPVFAPIEKPTIGNRQRA